MSHGFCMPLDKPSLVQHSRLSEHVCLFLTDRPEGLDKYLGGIASHRSGLNPYELTLEQRVKQTCAKVGVCLCALHLHYHQHSLLGSPACSHSCHMIDLAFVAFWHLRHQSWSSSPCTCLRPCQSTQVCRQAWCLSAIPGASGDVMHILYAHTPPMFHSCDLVSWISTPGALHRHICRSTEPSPFFCADP